jgi:hypothetical protein
MRVGDSSGLRAYNERLIVAAIRAGGPKSKTDVARATGLSAQAARLIVAALIEDGVLRKLAKVRGQIGQPATPIALNPAGAYAVGVKIGRRSQKVVLVDMLGAVVARRDMARDAPPPQATLEALCAMVLTILNDLSAAQRGRVVGLGIAMPGDLHEWPAEMDVREGALEGWKHLDPAARLAEATELPATLINDATAACAAEMIAGDALA